MTDITDCKLTIDSRDVAEMVDKRHDHLLRDIDKYMCYLGSSTNPNIGVSDFFRESNYKGPTGRKLKCYQITKKGCEFIANKLIGRKGAEFTATYINRFHEMENQIIGKKDSYMIADPVLRARRWIEEYEEKQQLITQVEQSKPKVIFADAVTASKTSILVGELAKLLRQNGIKTGQNRLFSWLRDNGYLIKRRGTDYNMPTQYSMDLELFEVKETSITHSDGHVSVSKTPKVTGKGQLYFINKFQELGLEEVS